MPGGQDWEIARAESSESEASVSAVGWTGAWVGSWCRVAGTGWSLGERRHGIRVRAPRQQRVLDGSLGQRGLALGLEGNRGVPGGAARVLVLLILMGGYKGNTIEGRGGV